MELSLNLRKARKLENKIAKHISAAELKTEVSIRAKAPIAEATTKRQEAAANMGQELNNLIQLNSVRYNLRLQIAQANESVGINKLMAAREELKSRQEVLQKLAGAQSAVTVEELQDILETTVKSLDKGGSGYGRLDVNVSTSLLLEETKVLIKETNSSLVTALEEVEDELAQKNLGAKVTLGASDVALLTANNLI